MNDSRPPEVRRPTIGRRRWRNANRSRSRILLAAALLASAIARPCAAAQPPTDEMLDAIIARGTAIFSAKIALELTSSIENDEKSMVDHSAKYTLTVTGDDWILRYDESPNFVMNHNDASIHYYKTESEEKGVYRSLRLSATETLDHALSGNHVFSVPRNGTFWHRRQIEFVDRQRDRVQQSPGEVIDGHSTVLLQWRVGMADLDDAIIVIPKAFHKDLAGYLKVYAAPSLGYALPRIDYVTLDGQLARRYESSDFVKIDSGLHFPQSTRCIAFTSSGRRVTSIKVNKIEYVNQDVPEEEFDVQIPSGTRIHDARPGVPTAVFKLGDQKEIDEISQIAETTDSKINRFSLRMVCLAANSLLVLLLVIVWIRRKCHSV